jgi:hypothetical protein
MSAFEENLAGRLTRQQQRLLLTQLAIRVALAILVALPVGIGFLRIEGASATGWPVLTLTGWLITVVSIGAMAYFLYVYIADVYRTPPVHVSGTVRKYRRKRLRGPDLYCLAVGSHRVFNVEIIVPVDIWGQIEDHRAYELFYAKRTRWLLSFHPFAS